MSARKGRRATGLAWTLCCVSIALAVAGSLLALQPGVDQAPDLVRPDRWQPIRPLYVAAFSIVGALIVGQRPASLVGWLCSAVGLLASLTGFGSSYASLALFVHPGSLPAGEWLFWLRSWSWFLAAALTIGFLPLLFPDGRVPSPRWRPLAWLIGVAHLSGRRRAGARDPRGHRQRRQRRCTCDPRTRPPRVHPALAAG